MEVGRGEWRWVEGSGDGERGVAMGRGERGVAMGRGKWRGVVMGRGGGIVYTCTLL